MSEEAAQEEELHQSNAADEDEQDSAAPVGQVVHDKRVIKTVKARAICEMDIEYNVTVSSTERKNAEGIIPKVRLFMQSLNYY